MRAAIEMGKEDLREFYITPLYLETMGRRVRFWTEDFIRTQLFYFKKTIADYPEVLELLENELRRRGLNRLRKKLRLLDLEELRRLLDGEYKQEPDSCEVIQTEIEIRSGAKRLKEPSQNPQAKITREVISSALQKT